MKHILFSQSKYAALLCMLLILPAWFSPAAAQARKAQPRRVDVSVAVVTPDGKPVPNAGFTVGEGVRHLRADEAGRIVFSVAPRDLVTVSAEGFTPVRALGSALAESSQVTLTPAILLAGENDDIPLPYTTLKKRYSVGSSIVIRGEELEKYSSTDIRNALTGLASGVEVAEKFGGPGVNPLEHIGQYGASTRVSVTTRGKQMMYMVDDIPVQIDETPLDPQQIESVTIVRDVLEKSLYGPSAANGIVYIKTKRGHYNDRYLTVDVEGGVNTVDRMPEYVSGADYARLNNIARNNSGLDMLYSRDDVAAYAKNDPYDKWNPSVDFRDMMLKNTMYYTKANVSSGGGNDLVRYFAFLGYAGEDDIYKIGPAANYNRVNINANLDIKLHRYIRARFGLVSTMGIRKSSNYGYSSNYSSEDASSNTTLGVTEFPDIISDINTTPGISFPIYANNDPSLESPWYAVSSLYKQNPVAYILENGAYTETIRKGLINVGVDVDFSFLTPGLTSMTYGAYDATNLVRLGTAEDYAAYILNKGIDENGYDAMIPEQSSSHSVKAMANKTKLLDYFSNRFYFVQKFAYDRTFGRHAVAASLCLRRPLPRAGCLQLSGNLCAAQQPLVGIAVGGSGLDRLRGEFHEEPPRHRLPEAARRGRHPLLRRFDVGQPRRRQLQVGQRRTEVRPPHEQPVVRKHYEQRRRPALRADVGQSQPAFREAPRVHGRYRGSCPPPPAEFRTQLLQHAFRRSRHRDEERPAAAGRHFVGIALDELREDPLSGL